MSTPDFGGRQRFNFNACDNAECLCLETKENGGCVYYREPETMTLEEFQELYSDNTDEKKKE